MQYLKSYAAQRLGPLVRRPINKHPDVQLLAQMSCFVAGLGYAQTGQVTSRNQCFLIVMEYLRQDLWPLTRDVPSRLQARSVFLGGGLFKEGSCRRWVADIHGSVLAQRFQEGTAPRRCRSHDERARTVRDAADRHLKNVIAEVTKLSSESTTNATLLQALHQLQLEVI